MPAAPVHPAVELTTVKIRVARAEDGEFGGDDPLFEAGERDGHLERRAGRVAPLNGAILKRLLIVVDERVPHLAVDARGEVVRVVRPQAAETKNFAIPRIEHNGRARVRQPAVPRRLEAVLDGLLDVGVYR